MSLFRFSVSGKILLDIFYDDCVRRLAGRSIVSKRIYIIPETWKYLSRKNMLHASYNIASRIKD